MTSLSLSIDKISEIEKKVMRIDKKEPENKFIDNMRSMMASLSQSINKISKIDKKISQATLIEKFPNTYQLCNKDLNKFALLLRKGVYIWTAGKDLKKNRYLIKNLFIAN